MREDLDDLCYHKPARHQEVEAKPSIVNEMLRDTLAEARHLILCIEYGCDMCHPDQGVAMNKTTYNQVSHNKYPRHQTGSPSASNLRTQWGRKQTTEKERM